MRLAEKILDNERKQLVEENKKLVRARLKELVYAFPKETLEVLHKTGVPVSTLLPSPVMYAIVVKHVATNSELREAIAKMLLETDGYSSANGQIWQMVGGALSAVGSVLGGIGRSQTEQTNSQAQIQAQQAQQQLELEKAKSRRQMWLYIGISAVVLIGIILGVRAFMKSKASAVSSANPQLQVS
jgi:predicted nucleic acid-binding Zn ribbon protein